MSLCSVIFWAALIKRYGEKSVNPSLNTLTRTVIMSSIILAVQNSLRTVIGHKYGRFTLLSSASECRSRVTGVQLVGIEADSPASKLVVIGSFGKEAIETITVQVAVEDAVSINGRHSVPGVEPRVEVEIPATIAAQTSGQSAPPAHSVVKALGMDLAFVLVGYFRSAGESSKREDDRDEGD